jgi:hypothetical protein
MRWVIPSLILFFSCLAVVHGQEDETPSDSAIKEAITILEARKAQAEGESDQKKIGEAIAALEKLLPKAKKEGDKPAAAVKITPAMLAKKLAGRTAFNPKTGELTLVYDFKAKGQLKDFDLKDAQPTLKSGVLRLGPSEAMKHIVAFKNLKVTGLFVVENVGAGVGYVPFIQTSAGISFGTSEFNGAGLSLNDAKRNLGGKQLGRHEIEGKPLALTFTVSEKRASAKAGTVELAGPHEKGAPSRLELLGGLGGLQVRSLVIAGVPDEEWVQEFFKD